MACLMLVSLLALPIQASAAPVPEAAVEFFVALDGSDENNGSITSPFATLERARDAVRALKQQSGLPAGGVTVNVRGGDYTRLQGSFELGEADSGTAESPVVYRAYPGEEVTFLGGLKLDAAKFGAVADEIVLARLPAGARDKVLVYDLAAEHGVTEFGEMPKAGFGWPALPPASSLIVNGMMQTVSRWPNSGFINSTSTQSGGFVPRNHSTANADGSCPECSKGQPEPIVCKYNSFEDYLKQSGPVWTTVNADLAAKAPLWMQESQIWTAGYFFYDWADDTLRIEKLEEVSGGLKFTAAHPSFYGMSGSKKFYAYNLLCEIDEPGEWYLDTETAKIYYYPNGELAGQDVYLSNNDQPLVLMENADYIRMENLGFSSSRSHGIKMLDCENNTIAGCRFADLGQQAVMVGDPTGLEDAINTGARGGKNNTVQSCNIVRMGQGGIYLGGGNRYTLEPANNLAINNDISDYSVTKRTYAPAIALVGVGNQALNNLIYDAPHMAISYDGNDFVIANNEIHNVCYETADVGVIYTCRRWSYRGVEITNNYIHDIVTTGGIGSAAIYVDDLGSGAIVTKNLFVNIPGYVTLFGGGRDNIFTNNIVLNQGNGKGLQYDARGEGWAYYHAQVPNGECYTELMKLPYLEEPWASRYPELAAMDLDTRDANGNLLEARKPAGSIIQDNILVGVANPTGNIAASVKNNSTVKDIHVYAKDADIGFAAPEYSDFTVRADSIITEKLGGEYFNCALVGLYQDEYRQQVGKPLNPPVLSAPANGAEALEVMFGMMFSWQGVENAANYRLMIATDEAFENVVKTVITKANAEVVTGLEKNTGYFWKVSALDGILGGSVADSATFHFTTSANDPTEFFDSFEDPSGLVVGWDIGGGTPNTSDAKAHTGERSYWLDETVDVITKTFSETMSGVVSAYFYDDMNSAFGTAALLGAKELGAGTYIGVGVDCQRGKTNYYVRDGGTYHKVNTLRTVGWHEFKIDYTSGTKAEVYIDDELVYTSANQIGFNHIEVGDWWNKDSSAAHGGFYFDDVRITFKYDVPVSSLSITPENATLAVGETLALTPGHAPVVARPTYVWSSPEHEIAQVDENGVVTGIREGAVGIELRADGVADVSATCAITVSGFVVQIAEGIENGSLQTNVAKAQAGDPVSVTVQPARGYRLVAGSLKMNGQPVVDDSFTMPAEIAVLTAEFEEDPAEADKTGLQRDYKVLKALVEQDYTSSSWQVFSGAMADAKALLDSDEAIQSEVDAAHAALLAAEAGLVDRGDRDALSLIILWCGDDGMDPDQYTADSWATYMNALAHARYLVQDDVYMDVSDEDVVAAGLALTTAYSNLTDNYAVDKTNLAEAVATAAEMLLEENVGKYLPASVEALKPLLAEAQAVMDNPDATQAEVDAAYFRLLGGIGVMYEKGDKTALQTLYDMLAGLKEEHFTPTSWAPFGQAMAKAAEVLANANALQDDVDNALANLQAAGGLLVRRANLASLNSAIAMAESILANAGDYIPSTLDGLLAELDAAKLVRDNLDATQAEVNAARAALTAKNLQARLKPNLSGLFGRMNRILAMNASLYTDDSWNALIDTAQEAAEKAKDPEITPEQVKGYEEKLDQLLAALKLKAETGGDPGGSTEPPAPPATTPPAGQQTQPATGGARPQVPAPAPRPATETTADDGQAGAPAEDTPATPEVTEPPAQGEAPAVQPDVQAPTAQPSQDGQTQDATVVWIVVLAALLAIALAAVVVLAVKARKKGKQ